MIIETEIKQIFVCVLFHMREQPVRDMHL